MVTVHIWGFGYLPWPLYLETFLSLGSLDFLAFPLLRFPKLILRASPDDFDFAISY